MKLKLPVFYGQRDSRWASEMLGYNTQEPYTIGNYGCLITCFGNYTNKTPSEVNTILKDNQGFADGGNFVWSKCTALGLNQTYLSPRYANIPVTPQGLTKIKESIDGGYPLVCEVDFNPSTTDLEMHYVLLIGYEEDTIYYADPWTNQVLNWGLEGAKRAIIQFRAYDKKLPADTQGETIPVEKTVFENLVRKSTICDKVREKLGVSDNESVILGEIDKLIGYEDALVSEQSLREKAQEQLLVVQTELQKHMETIADLSEENKKQADMIEDVRIDLKTANSTVTALQEQLKNQPKTWIEYILKGIDLLLRRR